MRERAGSLSRLGVTAVTRAIKQAATIVDHVARLRDRGMEIDATLAKQWLTYVSYYRLSAYWYPARVMDAQGRRTDRLKPGISFSDAVALYEADRKLRALVHDGMERVEIAMRTRVSELLVKKDPLAYTNPKTFRSKFDHKKWMVTAKKRISRAGARNEAIKHYRDEYEGEYPFWVLTEVLDFSDISRLYEGLPASDQRAIAEDMGIKLDLKQLSKLQQEKVKRESPLVRWMEQLTIVRNYCAHHARLWNKSFVPAPTPALRTLPEFALLPEGQSEQVFGALVVMANLVRTTSPKTTWPDKVSSLIQNDFLTNPLVDPESLGLPEDWNGKF